MKILLVDDDAGSRDMVEGAIEDFGHSVVSVENPIESIRIFKENLFDMVITDLKMPDMSGVELLKELKKIDTEIPVIILTAYSSVETAVEGLKSGAYDYLTKPINLDILENLLNKVDKYLKLIKEVSVLRKKTNEFDFSEKEVIGNSEKFRKILSQCNRVADKNINILIQGESGTGKEMVAKLIHNLSERKGLFVAVNCGAIPENLIESELFGHKKGSFTGAVTDRKGKFEEAHNGTLFLDEIGELPLQSQVKLLRAIQERKVVPVGSNTPVEIDVRIIAATNKNLNNEVLNKTFREDLYWRLAVVVLELPSLKERKDDIELLVRHFLEKNQSKIEITKEVFSLLRRYDWPGNIRELENVISRSIALCYDNIITVEDLPYNIKMNFSKENDLTINNSFRNNISLPEWISNIEKKEIIEILEKYNYVQVKAAEDLGISERMLRYNMQKYSIKKQKN
jgi:DNA-binding NtrC family response regulator